VTFKIKPPLYGAGVLRVHCPAEYAGVRCLVTDSAINGSSSDYCGWHVWSGPPNSQVASV